MSWIYPSRVVTTVFVGWYFELCTSSNKSINWNWVERLPPLSQFNQLLLALLPVLNLAIQLVCADAVQWVLSNCLAAPEVTNKGMENIRANVSRFLAVRLNVLIAVLFTVLFTAFLRIFSTAKVSLDFIPLLPNDRFSKLPIVYYMS